MSDRDGRREGLPLSLWRVPGDLAAVVLVVGLTLATVFVPGLRETPLRAVFGLVVVLFVPGYAIIAALFPGGDRRSASGSAGTARDERIASNRFRDGGIDGIERLVFSFGMSIVVGSGIGVALSVLSWNLGLVPIMIAVSVVSLLGAVVGAIRRQRLPAAEQFQIPYREWVAGSDSGASGTGRRSSTVVSLLLVLGILMAAGSVGYALTGTGHGGSTELYLLTGTGTGSPAPDTAANDKLNESRPLVIGVTNHERERVEYSVVVIVEDVAVRNDERQVRERERLRTFRTILADNETWQRSHTIAPTLTGENLRVRYLLYRGEPPSNPTVNNAVQEVHLWVDGDG